MAKKPGTGKPDTRKPGESGSKARGSIKSKEGKGKDGKGKTKGSEAKKSEAKDTKAKKGLAKQGEAKEPRPVEREFVGTAEPMLLVVHDPDSSDHLETLIALEVIARAGFTPPASGDGTRKKKNELTDARKATLKAIAEQLRREVRYVRKLI